VRTGVGTTCSFEVIDQHGISLRWGMVTLGRWALDIWNARTTAGSARRRASDGV
jgi:hypothetical protein